LFEGILGIKKPTFGLDIGFNSLKVVQVKGRGRGTTLQSVAEIEIPQNSLTKDGIKDKQKLADLIRKAVQGAKPSGISGGLVSSALPESLVFTKTIDLPKMTEKEINKNVPYQASEFFPIPVEETYMDWQVVGINPSNSTIEVLVVAAPKKAVNSLAETIKIAGYELIGLETKPISVTRALVPDNDLNSYLIVDIGAKTTGLTCYDTKTVKLTSTCAVGGDEITQDFSESLKMLASEIIHLIKYYQNRSGQAKVFKKLILCGGGANIERVADTIESLVKIKAELGVPQIRLSNYDPKFATAIGLAMKEI
jgi:type IV pilus assembly protein PilM